MFYEKNTKQVLAESLLQLSKSKPIEAISVVSIVKNCGAGRQTFYNHFTDKYDLINWIYTSYANQLFWQYSGTEPWGQVLGRCLSYMYNHKNFFGNVMNEEGQFSFFNSLYEYTKKFYMDYIQDKHGKEYLTDDLMFDIRFNSHGAVYMAKEWLNGGMKESPEIIGMRIANAMPQSLKKYF